MLVNHLKNVDPSSKVLEDAYGLHIVEGDLVMSDVLGTAQNFNVYLMQALGDGEWDGEQGIWFKGLNVSEADYKFHPGKFTPHPVYKNFTFDEATDTFTSNNHGYADGTMVFVRATGAGASLPTGFLPKKIYYVVNSTTNTFQLSETRGGAAADGTTAGAGVLEVWENDPVQGVDEFFNTDVPHSGTAWIRVKCPANVGDFNNDKNPPQGFSGIFRGRKVENYDILGNQTDFGFSTSPARVAAHLVLKRGKLPNSRIDWAVWAAWRDFCASQEMWDYSAQAAAPGIGLYSEYYNFPIPPDPQDPSVIPDFATATLVFKRIDPVIDMDLTNGSPGIGVQSEWFLVRWEGKVKAEFAEQYTFYVSHDNGARLWVNGVELVNNWTHNAAVDSGQINLNAEQLVDIKLEFFESWGASHIKLEWQSASQPRQVIPTERLFPKAHLKTRYESHAKFTDTTGLDAALLKVLTNTNSFVQDDGDKLKFYAFEQLAVSFAFNESNIKEGTFKFWQRDMRSTVTPLRNSWQADFRDLETQYFEKAEPPVVIELEDLQDLVGRVVTGETVALENMTRYQAEKVLRHVIKRETEMNTFCSFDALASAFAVLPGDLVTVTHSLAGWVNKTFIVTEATDKSSEETADERSFVLQEWTV